MNILLALLLCVQSSLNVTVEPFTAITAKSVRIEPLVNSVAVFLTERNPTERTGAFLNITSASKWATPYSPDWSIVPSKTTPNSWLFFAPAGKYKILIIEFDPDKGPTFNNVDVTIPGPIQPPPPPPPPPGDYSLLAKAAKDNADRLNDPPTRIALKAAYQTAINGMSGKTFDECRSIVITSRFAVFNARQGPSRNVDWESWKNAVDAELVKLVKAGETEKYIQAMTFVISGL